MKKLLAILLCLALLFSLAACSSSEEEEEWSESSNKKGSASSNKNNKDEAISGDDEDENHTHIIIGGNGSISNGNGVIGGIISGNDPSTESTTSNRVEVMDPDHTTDEDHTHAVQPTEPENSTDSSDPIDTTCAHSWTIIVCDKPVTCSKCGATKGDPLPHVGGTADCYNPAKCSRCGEYYGDIEHRYDPATCQKPMTCYRCGATTGGLVDHLAGKEPTCNELPRCIYCNVEMGEYAPHDWTTATCTQAARCKTCGTTGSYASHNMVGGSCTVCGYSETLNVTVSDLAPNAYPTYTSGGRITGVSYSVQGNDLYITVNGIRSSTVGSSTVTFGWTVYGGGYAPLQQGNSSVTTSGSSFSKTICVSGVITSSYKTYKVWVGQPH